MNEEFEFAKLVVPVIASWLAPTLQGVVKKYGEIKIDAIPFFQSGFEAYLKRSYEKYRVLNTVVFPNQRLRLDALYEPLTLTRQSEGRIEEQLEVCRFPKKQFSDYRNIMIVDTAGMGKSTIAKFIFLSAVRENAAIPILIELRRLSKDRSVLSFLKEELAEIKDHLSHDLIAKLIAEGGFLFIFDGYDEIPQEDRAAVTADIQDFQEKAKSNLYLMTSRDEPGLTAFADFMRFGIQPMTTASAYSLIERYATAAKVTETGAKLIEKLKAPDSASVAEFLTNPLLVSLLFKAFDYKHIVPLKRVLFYRQVFDALFEIHDLSKDGGELIREKRSGLGIDDFDQMLRQLAFIHVRSQRVEHSKDDLLASIDEAKKRCSGLAFSSSDFLWDLTSTVPIFVIDGTYYRWAHKSILEYFAAQFICRDTKGDQELILRKIALGKNAQTYLNLLSLCCEIDYKTFLHSVVFELLNELTGIESYQHHYPGVAEEHIQERRDTMRLIEVAILRPEVPVSPPGDPEFTMTLFNRGRKALERALGSKIDKLDGSGGFTSAPVLAMIFPHRHTRLLSSFLHKPGFEFVRMLPPMGFGDFTDLLELLNDTGEIVVTDAPDNPVNSPHVFHQVTRLIRAVQQVISVDYTRAREITQQIISSIEFSKSELADLSGF